MVKFFTSADGTKIVLGTGSILSTSEQEENKGNAKRVVNPKDNILFMILIF